MVHPSSSVVFETENFLSNTLEWLQMEIILFFQGSGRGGTGPIMDHHPLHFMANGRNARNGSWEKVRQIP